MNVQIKTKVRGNYKEIMKRFDKDLFEALAPRQGKMEIVEFTGSKKGDRVHIRFISPVKAEWISDIVEDYENEDESVFVDVGRKLPPPLKYWKHRHIVRKVDENISEIIDDMTFKSWNIVITALMYPAIWIAFWPRKKVYRAYFGEVQ